MEDTAPSALQSSRKIARPFSLTMESKAKLQEFFDARYEDLRSSDTEIEKQALEDLAELIGGNKTTDAEGRITYDHTGAFPPNVLQEMEKVFNGTSEYVVIVQNCPEIPIAKDVKRQDATVNTKEYYANHIGRALRQVCHAEEHCYSGYMTRSSHIPSDQPANIIGNNTHRDMVTRRDSRALSDRPQRDEKADHTEILLLSCPQNDEHAATRISNVKQALESISDIISDDAINQTIAQCIPEAEMTELKSKLSPEMSDDLFKNWLTPQSIRDHIRFNVLYMDDTIQKQYVNIRKNLKPDLQQNISYERKKVIGLPQMMEEMSAPLPAGNETKGIIAAFVALKPPYHEGIINRVINRLVSKINEHIEEHSITIDFQPGTLAFFDEGRMFHYAFQGDESCIQQIPLDQSTSRHLLHLSMHKKANPVHAI